jgi:hypothetical protein
LAEKCVNKKDWVDDPALNTADCSPGDYRRAQCEAIEGPNGGAGACTYKAATSECLNDPNFVDASPSEGERPPPSAAKANAAEIAVPLVAIAFLVMAAYFVKSRPQTATSARDFRDQWFANNLVTGKAGARHYPPHVNGREGEASLARSTATVSSIGSVSSSSGWFGESIADAAQSRYCIPHANGPEGEASLAPSTTAVSGSSVVWFGETTEPANLLPHYYPHAFLEHGVHVVSQHD